MPTRRQLIQKITLNASTTSVTFSNIPQNYTDLKIVGSARGTTNPFSEAWFFGTLGINNDGNGVNQSGRHLIGGGASTTAESFSAATRYYFTSSGATANTYGTFEIYFPNYTGSSTKSIRVSSAGENNASPNIVHSGAGLWSGTSPINQLVLFPRQDSFASGSTFYLYGITHVPIIRGGEVSIAGGYKIHTFRNTSSLQVIEGGEVEYLVIAGGASGGHNNGGGGGAGGYRSSVGGNNSGGGASAEPKLRITPGIHTITVGAGGASIPSFGNGANGSNSTFSTITAIGGGGGSSPNQGVASSGGSGGGGITGFPTGASGTANQGYAGGSDNTNNYAGGGGGGAGSVGGNGVGSGTSGTAGSGGSGVASNITGSSIVRAGGGGGGAGTSGNAQNPGFGGSGGGGNGGGPSGGATNGLANTGSGGGGARWVNLTGSLASGAGGSGIVIIRYPYDGN